VRKPREGNLGIIRSRSAGDSLEAYDHLVERSLVRLDGMRKLIMDLLDLTRLESGQKARTLEPLEVCAAAAAQCLETHGHLAAEQDMTLRLATAGPTLLNADAGELEIIFNNLVSNAIKYNVLGGTVTVGVEEDAEWVTLTVTDTGIGMTPEEVAKLFGEFSRIRNEKTRNILGSGLNLSILRRLAALYDGTVQVRSQPGQGSTFTVTLRK
jgi:signal transduction histidine kinase